MSEVRSKQHVVGTIQGSAGVATVERPRASREELIALGMRLVRRVALQLARRLPSHVELNDLISAGTVGMLNAVQAYQHTRSQHFEPYAKTRIRGAMIDELRANDLLSRYGRSQMGEIEDARHALRQALGRDPDDFEIATHLELPLEQYQRLTGELARHPVLIRFSMAPVSQPGPASAPDAALCDKDLKQRLASAVASLPEREQRVLRLYYEEEHTQAAVGALLGVSEGRINQLLTQAAARLRSLLEPPPHEPTPPPRPPAPRITRKPLRKD